MDRRTFNKLARLAALGALNDVEMSAAEATSAAGEAVLEDRALLVAFHPANGPLIRLEHKSTNWTSNSGLILHPYLWLDREARPQFVSRVLVLEIREVDAHGNALHHFDVVTGGVLRREEREH